MDYLKIHCDPDEFLGDLHSLLHADDTVILSTSKKQFIDKCNKMTVFFSENRLSLNIEKSAYMIVGTNTEKGQYIYKHEHKLNML